MKWHKLTILQRYLMKHILVTMSMVTVVVAALVMILGLLGEAQDVGKVGEQYNFYQAVYYVLLSLPQTMCEFYPLVILLGGVLGCATLNIHQELVIMRCLGVSLRAIILSCTTVLFGFMLLFMLCGASFGPHLLHKATIVKYNARHHGNAGVMFTKSGLWWHEDNKFIHVAQVIGRYHVVDITIYEFDAHAKLLCAYHLDSMDWLNKRWVPVNGKKTMFLPNGRTAVVDVNAHTWNLSLKTSFLLINNLVPAELATTALIHLLHTVNNSALLAELRLELLQRVSKPLLSIIMFILLVPTVLHVYRGVNLGLRVCCIVVVGFVLHLLSSVLGQLVLIYQLPSAIIVLIPLTLLIMVSKLLKKIHY